MTPERWQRIDELFQAAVKLEVHKRSAFLETACQGEAELLSEVQSLLAHAGNSAVIESVVEHVAGRYADQEAAGLMGKRVGVYGITGVIGRGGMGVVCAAVRDDEQFQKQVAIKLIKRGMDTAFVVSRFLAERQILAGLEHPGIARLIDGGATGDGQPYFVMEYVDGVPITTYCEVNRLPVTSRLRLFRQVCDAVQYAHRNLIVHRDIKPGNILVTTDGTPKLLDFGLARVLHPTPAPEQATFSALAVKMMTPDYASPEQVRSSRVTTATDVYSLGAVLYQLLTGERPHRLREYTPAEIERAVCETEIERPSDVVLRSTGRTRARQLRGDLDNIVLKAMRKAPERRYASVEQFSEDLQRYLDGKPVGARADTFAYRLRKFIGRHKLPVAAAAVALLSVAGGSVASWYQARRAEQRFQQVRKLAKVFLFDLHDRLQPLAGTTDTRRFVVRTGLDYLASLEREAGRDVELLRELARGYDKMGDVQGSSREGNLGDPAGAETSYRRAVAILERLPKRRTDRETQLDLADTYSKIGELQGNHGDWRGEVETDRKALAILEGLPGGGDDTRRLQVTGLVHGRVAWALYNLGEPQKALDHSSKSLAMHQQLSAMVPANHRYQLELSKGHRVLGVVLADLGRRSEALSHYREMVGIREGLVAREPDNAVFRFNLLVSYTDLGDHLQSPFIAPRDFEGALGYYRKAADLAESLSKQDAHDRRAPLVLSSSLARVGMTLRALKRFDEALYSLQRSLKVASEALAADPTSFLLRTNLLSAESEITMALIIQERWREARPHSRAAVETAEDMVATIGNRVRGLGYVLKAYENHVRVLGGIGDLAGVQASSKRILELAEETHPSKTSKGVLFYNAPYALSAVGAAYESLAGRSRDGAAKLTSVREACSWFRKSLERWNEMRDSGAKAGIHDTKPIEVKKQLDACEAQVEQLRQTNR